jgi:hypothetical protein
MTDDMMNLRALVAYGEKSPLRTNAARSEEARKVGALPEPGNAQLDGASARLPVPVVVAVALGRPRRR